MTTDHRSATWRARTTRGVLWISVIAWGILLGGKLFDHVVLVSAWSADPPASLKLLPYGPSYPVDTGDYFFPSSVALLVCSLAVFVSGWQTPWTYRWRLFLPPLMLLVILVFTVLWFWPANAALWKVAQGSADALQDVNAIHSLVNQWLLFDRIRIAAGAIAFALCVSAISVPFPSEQTNNGT
ncbi:MAG: DUF1772 domain-containing protein [Pyrinomonadaceae bacterium]